ncbi:hypothetical protein EON65_41715 [archaeon]|nr:MAG: hypothetical protein EON65_41715 [archaeon]
MRRVVREDERPFLPRSKSKAILALACVLWSCSWILCVKMALSSVLYLVVALAVLMGSQAALNVEDVFVPADCEQVAKPGDHILLEYQVRLPNGTISHSLAPPSQLYHVLLDQWVSIYIFLHFTAAHVLPHEKNVSKLYMSVFK